jgi:hypothetical protein
MKLLRRGICFVLGVAIALCAGVMWLALNLLYEALEWDS